MGPIRMVRQFLPRLKKQQNAAHTECHFRIALTALLLTPIYSASKGWMLFIHPDFLWNTSLAKKIRQYEYFSYAGNEHLFCQLRSID